MLAVAIASTISRALSYGTIYTTKLLRRGTDIDRTAPWRALADLKIADAMRPFRRPLPVPSPADGGAAPDGAALPGPVIYQADPPRPASGSRYGPTA
jgi:chloride channel protein, CIC family